MFEKIFNKIYGKINSYYLSLIISAILFPIYNFLFRLRIMLLRNGRKVTLTEEESKVLINDNRPLNLNLDCQAEDSCCSSGEIIDNRPRLSVIVPAYNVERYIEECINSILNQQTNCSFEVIVVNDGSTDNTLSKLNQYRCDERVTIVSQQNLGLSGARNKGLSVAEGDYCMFVDSDDRLMPGAIEVLMSEIIKEQADIADGSFVYFGDHISRRKGRPLWKKKRVIDLQSNPEAIMEMRGFACLKIYSRKLWEDVRFTEGLIFEDTIIKFIILRRAKKYVYIPKECYEYRQHNTSLTKSSHGSMRGMDSFYILPVMLEEAKRLTAPAVDNLMYRLVLTHMGALLYRRTKALEDIITDAMLIQCRSLLLSTEKYCPSKLDFYEKTLKNAIMNLDKDKWTLCCSMN